MKNLGLSLLFLLSTLSISHSAIGEETYSGFPKPPEQEDGWVALPAGRPFGVLPSDPRDLRLGLRANNKSEFEADVAGYKSFAGWKGDGWLFHTGLEGAAFFLMRKEGSAFPLHSSDGLIGCFGEASKGDWAYQLRYTHISAHISDGLTPVRQRFLYTREFLSLRAARQLGWLRVYGGYYFLTNVKPKVPRHMLQLGAYAFLPHKVWIFTPYLGGDLRIRSAQEGTTMQLAGGLAITSAQGMPPLRLTASYLKGNDLRGQFYFEPTEKWTFGVELDI